MEIMKELINGWNDFYTIILITMINIVFLLISIWIFLSDRTIREDINERVSRCEDAIMVIKGYTSSIEHDNSINGITIDELKKSIQLLKKDMKRMEQSLARFAPPLQKDTTYKTITVVNAKLK